MSTVAKCERCVEYEAERKALKHSLDVEADLHIEQRERAEKAESSLAPILKQGQALRAKLLLVEMACVEAENADPTLLPIVEANEHLRLIRDDLDTLLSGVRKEP